MDDVMIREACQVNFLLDRVMFHGGTLDDAVAALDQMVLNPIDSEVIMTAGHVLQSRVSARADAIMFARPKRKVRIELDLGDVQQGDILDGRLVVGTHTRLPEPNTRYRTRLMFELPGVRAENSPESEWTRWMVSSMRVTVYR